MDSYSEWSGQNIITPPTTSESFTLDFKNYGDVLGKPEFKVLLNNRWGVNVYPFKEVAAPRPIYVPSSFDVVTGRALDVQSSVPITPPAQSHLDLGGRYQSFSILLQPIPTRFELDEMCNLWEREVIVYFDLHIGGPLLQPFITGDTRNQIRSLNRQETKITFKSGPMTKNAEWLHICSSSTLMDKAAYFSKDNFRIIIRIDEMNKRPESSMMVSQADIIRREAFGARLLDPRHGDIIFRFPETGSPGHEEKTLFASSDLLIRFSSWFKQLLHGDFRESTPQSLEFHVNYDTDPTTNIPALRVKTLEIYNLNPVKALLSGNRKVIPVQNARFTDYHNILYYIYTGQLNLRFPPSGKDGSRPTSAITQGNLSNNMLTGGTSSTGTLTTSTTYTTASTFQYNSWELTATFPRAANPNEIYRLAGMMGLGELQTRAYHYLMSTCSVDNIFDRYFDPYTKSPTHASIRSIYQQFLARNWDKIRTSGQWAQLLRRYRATQSNDEAEYLLELMCEILNAVTWDPKISGFIAKAH